MRTPRRSLALAAATVALLAGCGGAPEDPTDDPPLDDGAPDAPTDADDGDGGSAAGGTTMRVHTVEEALQTDEPGSIHVAGLLIDGGSGWRLCSAVMESYPPQCGGESVFVEGLDPSDHPLEESGDVRWQTEATLVGEVEGDTLTVTGDAAAS